MPLSEWHVKKAKKPNDGSWLFFRITLAIRRYLMQHEAGIELYLVL